MPALGNRGVVAPREIARAAKRPAPPIRSVPATPGHALVQAIQQAPPRQRSQNHPAVQHPLVQAAIKAVQRSVGGGGSHAPFTPPPQSLAYHANPIEPGVTGRELRFQQNSQFGPGAMRLFIGDGPRIGMSDFRVPQTPESGYHGYGHFPVWPGGVGPRELPNEDPRALQGTRHNPLLRPEERRV